MLVRVERLGVGEFAVTYSSLVSDSMRTEVSDRNWAPPRVDGRKMECAGSVGRR